VRLGVASVGLAAALGTAEAPAATASRSTPSLVHQVKPGETLYSIARRYGVSVAAIATANHLPRARAPLRAGRTLTIPRRPGDASGSAVTRRGAPARRPVKVTRASIRDGRPRDALDRGPVNMLLAVPDLDGIAPAFVWPVDGIVSSSFGRRRSSWHRGIDIRAELGTPILASAGGVVITSGVEFRYGRVVKVAHEGQFVTVYAHNHENMVQVGEQVAAGQIIARIGQTGRATSPHLHFEIRHAGRVVNPLYLLPLPPRVALDDRMDDSEDETE
jgi:murein DD-endopeptidase MepM/ murein hydrolase activator NlpD